MCYGYTRMLKHMLKTNTRYCIKKKSKKKLVIVFIKFCVIIDIIIQQNMFMINELTDIAFHLLILYVIFLKRKVYDFC